jgi:hypothetical protein
MVYRKLGKSNWEVSILAFGCMLLPIKNGGQKATDRFDPAHNIIGKRFGKTALPGNFLIHREGNLQAKHFGCSEAVKMDFEGRLKELLSNP